MKRKVIQLAGSTLVVSLPNAWTKAHGVTKGDEVEVEALGTQLRILLERARSTRSKKLSVTGSAALLNRTVGALYKAGFDRIELLSKDASHWNTIQATIGRTCIGLEVLEQGKERMLLKILSYLDTDEFDTVLRRLFLSLMSMGEDLASFMEKNDEEGLKNIVLRDDNNNKYADFLRRVINLDAGPTSLLPGPTYYLLEQLERVGDLFRDLAKACLAGDRSGTPAFRKRLVAANTLLRSFYGLFYTFSLERTDTLLEEVSTLSTELAHALPTARKEELPLFVILQALVATIKDMHGALLTLRL